MTLTQFHATLTVAPENVDAYLEAVKPVVEAGLLLEENVYMEVTQDAQKPGRFRVIESWTKPEEWLQANWLSSPVMKEYFAKAQPLFIEPVVIEPFQRVRGHGDKWVGYKAGHFTANAS